MLDARSLQVVYCSACSEEVKATNTQYGSVGFGVFSGRSFGAEAKRGLLIRYFSVFNPDGAQAGPKIER